jgi:hypothetical protein
VKISKVSLLFLIVGVVVIAALSLGMTHSSQSDQQKQLQSQLMDANKKLSLMDNQTLVAQQAQLTQDISKYTSQIDATKGKLTSNWDSIDAIKQVLSLAGRLNVDVSSITSSPVGAEQLGGTPCDTLTVDIQIQGAISNVRDFVLGLSQNFPTGMVKSVQLDVLTPASDAPADPGKDTKANVHLVIYTYGGK